MIYRTLRFLIRLFKKQETNPPLINGDSSPAVDSANTQKNDRVWPLPDSWKAWEPYINIDPTAVIDSASTLSIPFPAIENHCYLRVGADSHVFGKFVFQKPDAHLVIGDRCHIGSSTFVVTKQITLGDDVIVSWGGVFADGANHSLYWPQRANDVSVFRTEYLEFNGHAVGRYHDWSNVGIEPILIDSKVWISFNCIILKGVSIQEGAVIGAGAVVTKSIPSFTFAAGNPAIPKKRLIPDEGRCSSHVHLNRGGD